MTAVSDYSSVVFSVPCLYPSFNELLNMNRWERSKLKKRFLVTCLLMIKKQQVSLFSVPVKISIDLNFKKRRKRDIDNYSPKFLLDALVKIGVIPDDSSEWIPNPCSVRIFSGEPENKIDVKIEKLRLND